MKKLLTLFSAFLISGYCSAQSADGTFSSGYSRCFKDVAGVTPKKIPVVNSDWQSKDEVIGHTSIGFTGGGVQFNAGNSTIEGSYEGCRQGKIDGLAYLSSASRKEKSKS